jgi:plastocyanin
LACPHRVAENLGMNFSQLMAVTALVALPLAVGACSGNSSTGGGGGTVPGAAVTVTLKNTAFNPTDVTIRAGQAVGWVWEDGIVQHDVNFGSFKSALQSQGQFTHTFATPGTFHYNCDVHPAMKGTIEVTA